MTELATTDTTPAARRPVALGVPIKGLDEAYRLSQALAMANLLPDALRGKPSDVLAIILYGQELGLAPMQAIQGIYVVKGKPQLSAQTWLALVRREGHDPEVLEHTAGTCTVRITRGDTGKSHTETFTLDDAKTAELLSNTNYKKNPKRMLLARAVTNCCKFICPEIALGFYGEGEDFEGDRGDDGRGVVADPIQPPMQMQNGDGDQEIEDAVVVDPEAARAEVEQIAAELGNPLEYSQDEIAEGAS